MSGLTDPIADLLTRIRNAGMAHHPFVLVPVSKNKVAITKVLREAGFIREYEVLRGQPHRVLRIHLLYDENKLPLIKGIKRVSKPGLRVYVGKKEIRRTYGGFGVSILTTPQGMMTGEEAQRRGVGGEVICEVW